MLCSVCCDLSLFNVRSFITNLADYSMKSEMTSKYHKLMVMEGVFVNINNINNNII